MSADQTHGHIRFPELDRLRLQRSATKLKFSDDAGTSRNTLDKILRGRQVRSATVASILDNLEKSGYDVTEARAMLMKRVSELVGTVSERRVQGASFGVVVDNSAESISDFSGYVVQSLENAETWLIKLEKAIAKIRVSDSDIEAVEDVSYKARRFQTILEGVERALQRRKQG